MQKYHFTHNYIKILSAKVKVKEMIKRNAKQTLVAATAKKDQMVKLAAKAAKEVLALEEEGYAAAAAATAAAAAATADADERRNKQLQRTATGKNAEEAKCDYNNANRKYMDALARWRAISREYKHALECNKACYHRQFSV